MNVSKNKYSYVDNEISQVILRVNIVKFIIRKFILIGQYLPYFPRKFSPPTALSDRPTC